MRLVIAAALLFTSVAQAQPYDYKALLRTLGYSAGQAAACGIDTAEKASTVVAGLAAAIGYRDENTLELLDQTAAASRERGCRTFSGDDSEFRARWARMKRRLSID